MPHAVAWLASSGALLITLPVHSQRPWSLTHHHNRVLQAKTELYSEKAMRDDGTEDDD